MTHNPSGGGEDVSTRDRPTMQDLEATVERWLIDAREQCVAAAPSSDLDWLGGRIRALLDVLAFVGDGTDLAPPGTLPVAHEEAIEG